jgi:CDP-4-dehydro-6-deoxyglucose reductase
VTESGPWTAPIRELKGDPVRRITLQMPAGFTFRAGHYVEIVHRDGSIPLSIASAPWRLPALHLHYLSTPGAAEAALMDELLATGEPLTVRGPAGEVQLPQPLPGPLLLVAGGTGIAQALAFVDAFQRTPPATGVTLVWCVDTPEGLYLLQELEAMASDWLTFVPIVDGRRDSDNAALHWLREHVIAGADGSQAPGPIVLAGSPGFVYAAFDALTGAGADPDLIQSDVFAYAPRVPPD